MNSFDLSIAKAINDFVGTFPHFDAGVVFISRSDLLKGGELTPILWLLWGGNDNEAESRREGLIALIWACFFSLMTARLLASILPFRVRPIYLPELALHLPHGLEMGALKCWSSLPSDHAALFVAFSIGLFFVSRVAGCFALVYTLIVIVAPRLYLGLHYPTDLLLGSAVGIASGWVCRRPEVERRIVEPLIALYAERPGWVLAGVFLVTSQIAVMFEPLLDVVKFVAELVRWSQVH